MTRPRPDAAQDTVDLVRRTLGQSAASRPAPGGQASATARSPAQDPAGSFDFTTLPEYDVIKITRAVGDIVDIQNPYYRLHDGIAGGTTSIAGRTIVNFASYDYLGVNGHPEVSAAAKQAIDGLGTSVSASRLSAGERQVHRDLEAALAKLHGAEDAVAFVSGHATNVSVIGQLLSPEDLIICDAVIHNSILEGARLSGAKRILCPHGDLEAVERALRLNRSRYRRALIAIEGLYGMDGDVPDLAALVKIKRRYNAWLMVDEAHATGVLGRTGRGIAEEQNVAPTDVEIWMGTLSKAFASAGGYIAGSRALAEIVKYNSPGFIYSVGLPPPVAAAATAAIELMHREPWRVEALRRNGRLMLDGAKARGLDTGHSIGASVVPVIVGSSPHTVILAERLLARGFNVAPAIFPGVAENQARLRFFMTARHTADQISAVLEAVAEELAKIRSGPSFVNVVAGR
jgi:8-amino-7-oxononanoate synthase